MPPKKRTLQALDEVVVPQRAPKRAVKNSGAGKENESERIAVDESQHGTVSVVDNPAEIIQKEQPQANLRMGVDLHDPEHPNAVTEYVCILDREGDDDDDGEEDEVEDNGGEEAGDKAKKNREASDVYLQPADDHPQHKLIVTRATNTLVNKYRVEIVKRNQDEFSCHFYNDFTGYGQQEVIENILQATYNEFVSKKFDLHRFWVHIEALAVFFYSLGGELMWPHIDDCLRVLSTLALIGVAVLTALNKLEAADLLKHGSSIKNIPLILSMYLMIADDHDDEMSHWFSYRLRIKNWTHWPDRIVAYARHHNIELSDETGIKNTDKLVQKFDKAKYDKFPPKRKSGVDRWGYKRTHKEFAETYGHRRTILGREMVIGGDGYDVTKIPKKERIQKSYGEEGKDPIDDMGPLPEGIWKF